jgi:hypothetical protein
MEGLSEEQPINIPPCEVGRGIELCRQILKDRFGVEDLKGHTIFLVRGDLLKFPLGEDKYAYIDVSAVRIRGPMGSMRPGLMFLMLLPAENPEKGLEYLARPTAVGPPGKKGCLGVVLFWIGLTAAGLFVFIWMKTW